MFFFEFVLFALDVVVVNNVLLASLCRKKAEEYMADGKVVILLKSTGNAPPLKIKKFQLKASSPFSNVIEFLRKQLKLTAADDLFLFINCTFQPSPDEQISDLFKCFHNNGKLVVNYCMTAAWG
eukprot:TRINITY_DN3321_c0_g1_i2.p1 TRINITY_DN3321_c0_g1~~TRINITY_DN3321_c0_g1_i2.p1  ORF type:complete len:124 (+),score=28.43 TRINITY_DN3321_c0_g1_i2:230-601(+)